MIDHSDVDPFGEENWEPVEPIVGGLNKQLITKLNIAAQYIHEANRVGLGNYLITTQENVDRLATYLGLDYEQFKIYMETGNFPEE